VCPWQRQPLLYSFPSALTRFFLQPETPQPRQRASAHLGPSCVLPVLHVFPVVFFPTDCGPPPTAASSGAPPPPIGSTASCGLAFSGRAWCWHCIPAPDRCPSPPASYLGYRSVCFVLLFPPGGTGRVFGERPNALLAVPSPCAPDSAVCFVFRFPPCVTGCVFGERPNALPAVPSPCAPDSAVCFGALPALPRWARFWGAPKRAPSRTLSLCPRSRRLH